jgi:glyoxylase-like metal-dependent hydrolase (beta-lactamase superfamily II)
MHALPNGIIFFERGWLSSNNVLLNDETQSILIDSGYWTHAKQTEALITSVIQERPLTKLLNTHLHSDHCGGNAHLQAVFPNLETLIPPGHAPYVDNWDAAALTYTPTGQHCPPFTKTGLLHDGDYFDIAGKVWRIHAAPGHDPHSIVIFNENDGILISADALWENGFGVIFPEIEGLSAFDDVESTLQVIERLNPKLILPGHGAAFTDVKGALARARTRLEQFRNSTENHRTYATKVLLKFKLLELQKSKLIDYREWARSTQYLQILHKSHLSAMSFDMWFLEQCKSLEKSKACTVNEEYIVNIN